MPLTPPLLSIFPLSSVTAVSFTKWQRVLHPLLSASPIFKIPANPKNRVRTFSSSASNEEKQKFDRELSNLIKRGNTYYEVLGVKRHDDFRTIKQAYLRLAKLYHPDQSVEVNSSQKFQEVVEAFAVLGSKWKRPLYDRTLDFGEQTYGESVDDWRERWAAETEEERTARRERYKRYAKGVRTDFPPSQTLSPKYLLVIVGGGVLFILTIISTAPDKLRDDDMERSYDDEDTEDLHRGVPYVRAFHNPIADRWERLPAGCDPPSPVDLQTYYCREYPSLKIEDIRIPMQQLTVVKVLRTKTSPAHLVKDIQTGQTMLREQLCRK